MDNNNQTPDNRESSPIRGLFKKNEEAYNKHQREIKEEKQKLIEEEQKKQEEKSAPVIQDTAQQHVSEVSDENKGLGGKMRSFFGKLKTIIAQPEDAEFDAFDDDEEELTGIFARKKNVPSDDRIAEMVMEERKATAEAEITESIAQAAGETAQIRSGNEEDIGTSAVLYSVRGEDDEEVTYDASETPAAVKKEPEPPVQETAGAIREQPAQPEEISAETAPAADSGKTEITLEAILKAKESAILKTPITYIPEQNKTVLSENEDKTAAENVQTGELSHDAPAPKPTPEKAQNHELSHDAPAPKPTPEKAQNHELSHDAPASKPTPEKAQNHELSHDAPASKPTPEKAQNHELSHDAPAPKPTPEKAQVSELSHDGAAAQSVIPQKDLGEGISEPMVYRHSDSVQFVVMAGKFTATVRREYENIRRIRGIPPTGGGKTQPADTERSAAAPIPKTVPAPKTEKSAGKNPAEKITGQKPVPEKAEAQPEEPKKPLELKPPKEKKKLGARIKGIFSAEGDVFDINEDEFVEEKPEIADYGSEEDADEIRNDINYNFSKVFARTIVLAVTSVLSVVIAVMAQVMPSLFNDILRNGWLIYGIISFLLTATAFFAGRYTIVNGLMALRHIKGNSDTAPAVAALGSAIQSVTALFLPDVYVNGTYHLYSCLAVLALLFNSVGKLLIIKRTADNFRFLCSGKARLAGKIFSDDANANKFCTGLPIHRPIIAYMKKSRFMSNFLHLSYASDPVEDNAAFLAPFTAVLSLMCGIAYGVMRSDFVGGVCSFALTSFITVPICSLVALNIPMKNLCSSSLRKGAMVVGYEAVNQFCDTNAIMLESAQLYPKGSIILSGIKPFNESKLNDALLAGASVSFAVGGAMSHVFETIIQDRRHMVPPVDSVSYDDEMGLSGWIGGQRILLGNRELMEKHNIDMPPTSVEEKYRRMGNEIAYISMSGELIAMFVLTYKVDRGIAHALRELTDNGVSLIVRTIDPNITQEHIARKFSIYQRCIKILPTGLGTICHNELTGSERSSRAYVATNGRVTAFAAALTGCIRIRSTVTIAKIIQVLAIVLGFMLVSVISFVSGFEKLGGVELLLYTGFWCAALILVSAVARKLS